jgi:Lipid A 3-O-deacylase (PagL)
MNIRKLAFIMFQCLSYPAASLGQDLTGPASVRILPESKSPDLDSSIYYKNKLEYSQETGWLPINIPFVFDCFVGDSYNQTPLKYTLAPTLASLRWQMGDVRGPGILRGTFDLSFSGAFTWVARGPETHYWAYDMGIRRNFVRRNWRTAPYFDIRLGVGRIDAKGPLGVLWAQGQDLTFTFMMGSGVRYNFNSRYAISFGLDYMHVSNLYLSEPRFLNYGINVYGPLVGFNVRLGKPKRPVD